MAVVYLPFAWLVCVCVASFAIRSKRACVHQVWSGFFLHPQSNWLEKPNDQIHPKIREVHLIEFGHVICTVQPYGKFSLPFHPLFFRLSISFSFFFSPSLFLSRLLREHFSCAYSSSTYIWVHVYIIHSIQFRLVSSLFVFFSYVSRVKFANVWVGYGNYSMFANCVVAVELKS